MHAEPEDDPLILLELELEKPSSLVIELTAGIPSRLEGKANKARGFIHTIASSSQENFGTTLSRVDSTVGQLGYNSRQSFSEFSTGIMA
jgi:hypothetical protein